MSIVAEHPARAVRMAYLATVAGCKVNGVAGVHGQLLGDRDLPDVSQLWPEKCTNVTNGVRPRRFLRLANRGLSELISSAIGTGWVTDLERLRELEPYAEDAEFRSAFRDVKTRNKAKLNEVLIARDGIELGQDHMLDAVSYTHLDVYKRQASCRPGSRVRSGWSG